jgi:small subunit ribosomal protein S12
MSTLQQIVRRAGTESRQPFKPSVWKTADALRGAPHVRGVCVRVFQMAPKKPHSANRWVAQVRTSRKQTTLASIPGEGHNLQEHSTVLPGVRYRIVRGKYDCIGVKGRVTRRSKYGVQKQAQA